MASRFVRWNGEWVFISGSNTSLTVTTVGASDRADTSVTVEGSLDEIGMDTVDVWFEWGEDGTGLPNSTAPQTVSSRGTFEENLTGLDPDTAYEFRAHGENATYNVSDTGAVQSVTTLNEGISSSAVADNMDTWWPMNDGSGSATVVDAVGSRNLDVVGSPTLNADHIEFSGTDGERLEDTDNAGSYYGGQTQFTYFGWIHVPSGLSRENVIASLYDTSGDNRSWFLRSDYGSDSRVEFNISSDGNNFETRYTSSVTLPTDEWYSVAFAADTSVGDYRFYINGVEHSGLVDGGPHDSFYEPSIDFYLGDLHYDATRTFDGRMREHGVAFSALDGSTIQQIHDETGP